MLRILALFAPAFAFVFFASPQSLPTSPGASIEAEHSVLLDAASEELTRSFRLLREGADPAPYYLAYEVTEIDGRSMAASLGGMTFKDTVKRRFLDVSARVGSPKLDNYRRLRGDPAQVTAGAPLAYEDNANSIRRRLWLETDRAYRAAAGRFARVLAHRDQLALEPPHDDFSAQPVMKRRLAAPPLRFDADGWSQTLLGVSARFRQHPRVLMAEARVAIHNDTRYIVNSEGSRIVEGRGFATLQIRAAGKAADGAEIEIGESFDAGGLDGLPEKDKLTAAADRVAADLIRVLDAPEAEPFTGPAIFSGGAAAVLFHELLGHGLEGRPPAGERGSASFTVGAKVLPGFLTVVFDPTRRQFNGVDLDGAYDYDDEAAKARRVVSVDHGTVAALLASRSPVTAAGASNGHGRRQPGNEVLARQSNLFVESENAVTESTLRQMLIAEIKRQRKPYGLYFREIAGASTAGRGTVAGPWKVLPVLAYRVYADNRPDEPVRGAEFAGVTEAVLLNVLATGNRREVFNGVCRGDSGAVPVSAVSPAILVSEIGIRPAPKRGDGPAVLPPPPSRQAIGRPQ